MNFKEILDKTGGLVKRYCINIPKRAYGVLLFALCTICIIIYNNIHTTSLTKYNAGELDNARICSTILPLDYSDNQFVIFGGYNTNGTSRNVELYNIADAKSTVLFKSNFDNSYGNFAKIITRKNEKILINIQPMQFTPGAKYGIETYNFSTGELKLLDFPIKKRAPNDNVRYSFDYAYIYIMDDSNEVEMLDYFNYAFGGNRLFFKKTNTELKNFGMKRGIAQSSKTSQNNTKANNPIIFELGDGSIQYDNSEFITIDGTKIYKETQWDIYAMPIETAIKIPAQLKNAEIINVVQIDNEKLLFVFKKDNERYFAAYELGDKKLRLLGKTTSGYNNQNYIVFDSAPEILELQTRRVILQVGGIRTNKPFNCGDKLDNNVIINSTIEKIFY